MFFLIGLDWDLMRLSYSVISIYIYVTRLECDYCLLTYIGEGGGLEEERGIPTIPFFFQA